MYSVSYIKSIPTHEKLFAVGKSGPKCHFLAYFFLGLGWPRVGEFVGFTIICTRLCFPTQQILVNRKHPTFYAAIFAVCAPLVSENPSRKFVSGDVCVIWKRRATVTVALLTPNHLSLAELLTHLVPGTSERQLRNVYQVSGIS